MAQRGPLQGTDQGHGFLRHRRRECALMVQGVTGEWLKRRGYVFLTNGHDLTNAFASSARPCME
eukprot:3433014-Pyramimonas_sp.AAC.1